MEEGNSAQDGDKLVEKLQTQTQNKVSETDFNNMDEILVALLQRS